jgi:hypothetical protein
LLLEFQALEVEVDISSSSMEVIRAIAEEQQ